MAKRYITKRQEQAYRLVHIGEWSIPDTAKLMGISPRAVQRLLACVKKTAPQLFIEENFLPRGRIERYDPSMDNRIKQVF
jgi:predicted DNA-binding protein (UPF0251 family)